MCLSVIFGNLHESHLHVKVRSADKSTASRFSKSYLNRLRNSIYNLKKKKKAEEEGEKRQLTDIVHLVLYIIQTMSNAFVLFYSTSSSSLLP